MFLKRDGKGMEMDTREGGINSQPESHELTVKARRVIVP